MPHNGIYMNRKITHVFICLVLVFCTISLGTLSGCGKGDLTDLEYLRKGKDYYQQGNYKAGIIELKNALKQNHENIEARWTLGLSYLEVGNYQGAEKELLRVRNLGMAESAIAVPLLRALLYQGKHEEALALVASYKGTPVMQDPEVHVLHGEALLGLGKVQLAGDAFARALKISPDTATAHVGLARINIQEGEYARASEMLGEIIEKFPAEITGWNAKGDLEFRRGRYQESEVAYKKAYQLESSNYGANTGLVRSLLAQGNKDDASGYIKHLSKLYPGNPWSDYYRAVIFYQDADYDKAEAILQEVLRRYSDHAPASLLMGATKYAKGQYEQARLALAKLVQQSPGHLYSRKLLASTYLKLGQPDKAVAVLKTALEQRTSDAELLTLVGTAAIRSGDLSGALSSLKQAEKLSPDSTKVHIRLAEGMWLSGNKTEALHELELAAKENDDFSLEDFVLVIAYIEAKKTDEALATVDKLLEEHPDHPLLYSLKGTVFAESGDMVRAQKNFERAWEIEPGHVQAGSSLARIAAAEGNYEQALHYYNEILKFHKDHMATQLSLATLYRKMGNTEKYAQLIELARKAHPQALTPRIMLARQYLHDNKLQLALAVIREVGDEVDRSDFLEVAGITYLRAADYDQAEKMLSRLASKNPLSSQAHLYLARALIGKGKIPAARKSLLQAASLNKDDLATIVVLAEFEIEQKNIQAAKEWVERAVALSKDKDVGDILLSKLYLAQGASRDAVDLLEKVVVKRPTSMTVILLSQAYLQAGDMEKAIESVSAWLTEHSSDTNAMMQLARLQMKSDQAKDAIMTYEKIRAMQPDNLIVLNNLAALYQASDPGKSLSLAKRAYELAPNSGDIQDTYGWALLANGNNELALPVLRKAHQSMKNVPTVSYHYAVGLARTGSKADARSILTGLLEQSFPEAVQARELLHSLDD